MIKKLSLVALASVITVNCLADDVSVLKISKSAGESAVVLSELQSIKFTDSDMVINMKDGTKQFIAFNDIIVMELGQTPTSISSIFPDTDEAYMITDLRGNILSKGKDEKFVLPMKRGIYILSVGEKSKKILVK